MSAVLVSERSLEDVFASFGDMLATLVGVTTVEASLRDGETWLRLRYESGKVTREAGVTLPYEHPTVATVAFGRTLLERGPARFSMPLAVGDDIVGAVSIRSDSLEAYDDADSTVVQSVAPYLAVTIRQRMLLNSVERERFRAQHDALTNLANRDLFGERARAAFALLGRRSKDRVALLYLDVDGFKTVNDIYGHDAGDRVLVVIASRLREALRRSDTIARMGGDEFAVLLEGVRDEETVSEIRAKLLSHIERPIVWNDRRLEVTVSVGWAMAPTDGGSAQELLQRADARMYAHKSERRPRAV
jgi:diguanylate cyclase (GGDEF)-like protein